MLHVLSPIPIRTNFLLLAIVCCIRVVSFAMRKKKKNRIVNPFVPRAARFYVKITALHIE